MTQEIDELDRRILQELAIHGRIANTDLAARLPLSHSAISRRITRMEHSGVIRGYGASIDPAALGYTIRAFIGVRREQASAVHDVGQALREIDGVTACWLVAGEHDYLLDVRARDMATLSDILLNGIQKVHGVVSTVSTFVLGEAVAPAAHD